MKKLKDFLSLYLVFFKIGCFTFGGGWSIIAQIKEEYVEKRKTLTNEELLDLTSVGRSLPGIMVGNTAMLFGYKEKKLLGGLACVLGICTAPIIILIIVTHFYSILQGSIYMEAVMKGIRAAVVPIIISAITGMIKSGYKFPPCILITIITFSLYLFLNVSCIYLVIIGAVLGIIICEYYERRGKSDGNN